MMSRVEWTRLAKNDLAELWISATDRNEVTQSAREIEDILTRSGKSAGESRTANLRVLFTSVLGCYYVYREADQTAVVIKVWQRRKTSK